MTDTTTTTWRVWPEIILWGGVRTLDLGGGLILTRAIARQLDRIDCFEFPLSGGCIKPLGRVRTGTKAQVERKLPGHPGTVTSRHTHENGGWRDEDGEWSESIDIDPYLEVIGHDPDTGALVIWECGSFGEYLKYGVDDDETERVAVSTACDTLPLIVLP